jgi:hypothetical protein
MNSVGTASLQKKSKSLVTLIPYAPPTPYLYMFFLIASFNKDFSWAQSSAASQPFNTLAVKTSNMRKRGFVFSLDAFVAFVLIMVTVNFLIFTMGTPKAYHSELEAAHILAHDTLEVLATSGDEGVPETYLERILANQGDLQAIHEIMARVAGGNPNYYPIIPHGYGYKLDYLDWDSSTPGNEVWQPLYDAGVDGCARTPRSDRCGKNFTKLQASSTAFMSVYSPMPYPGESPFCHASCHGYEGVGAGGVILYKSTCNVTPCDIVKSNFLPGQSSVRILRLVVYT